MTHEWMLEQTWDLLLEYAAQLPQLELYRAYPAAQMMAFVGNALGGKSKGDKKADPDKLFSPLEMLAWFAQPQEVRDALRFGGNAFDEAQVRLIADAVEARALPSWAVQMIDQLQPLEVMVLSVKPHLRK